MLYLGLLFLIPLCSAIGEISNNELRWFDQILSDPLGRNYVNIS